MTRQVTGAGRRPPGNARLRRVFVVQQCVGWSDTVIEKAIYDNAAIRDFVGGDPTWGAAPDATMPGHFRHFLEVHALDHDTETVVLADAGYQGVETCIGNQGRAVQRYMAMKRTQRKASLATKLGRMWEKLDVVKASVPAEGEHPLHVTQPD